MEELSSKLLLNSKRQNSLFMSKYIRLLTSREMNIVQVLAHATWPDTFKEILSSEQITYMLDWMYNLETLAKQVDNGHTFYVYFENEIPLGFIGIELHHPTAEALKIHKLYVLPNTQGKGIGKQLITKAIEIAKANGINELILNVNRFNKAVEFYKNLGFTIAYEENIDIGNGYLMEDFVMKYAI